MELRPASPLSEPTFFSGARIRPLAALAGDRFDAGAHHNDVFASAELTDAIAAFANEVAA